MFRPVLSQVVRQGVFAMADRFIAGATPEEAVPALRELAKDGIAYTVDLLGEETLSDAEADAYLERYVALIRTLAASAAEVSPHGERWAGVPPVNISIKLSALCPHLEPAAPEWVSEQSPRAPAPAAPRGDGDAAPSSTSTWSSTATRTSCTRAFADVVAEPEFREYPHIGIVVQAYLRDAEEDVRDAAPAWPSGAARRSGCGS